MVKDDWPPRILLEILKVRFSLHMVKDGWPPLARIWPPARIWPEFLKFRFSLYIVKDDWPPTPWPGFYQNF